MTKDKPDKPDEAHMTSAQLSELIHEMISGYNINTMCPVCLMAVLSTLVGTCLYHAIESTERDDYLVELTKHAQVISALMERAHDNNVVH